ncbi:MAG: hypothetical protein NUV54_00745 [Candidatus Taylorbacteria bacterium]|nr:hypothetical protein [Candidatus Taylorbacteria bacterium]
METGLETMSMANGEVNDTHMPSVALLGNSNLLQHSINTVALVVAFLAVVVAIRMAGAMGGRIRKAIFYFILGIVANALAVFWTLFFAHQYLVWGVYLDVHQNLMSLGMIFFVISTYKFSKLVQNV